MQQGRHQDYGLLATYRGDQRITVVTAVDYVCAAAAGDGDMRQLTGSGEQVGEGRGSWLSSAAAGGVPL